MNNIPNPSMKLVQASPGEKPTLDNTGSSEKSTFDETGSSEKSTLAEPCFDDFWALYPRRVAKLAARKAWARIDPRQHVAILTACAAWRPVWADKDPEYIPHPASWLNGERWEDELPRGYSPRPGHALPVPADPIPAPLPRTAIPEHVRALLAKLRGKEKPAG